MEDVKFSSKLRDYGNVSVITPKIKSSKRKFSREDREDTTETKYLREIFPNTTIIELLMAIK